MIGQDNSADEWQDIEAKLRSEIQLGVQGEAFRTDLRIASLFRRYTWQMCRGNLEGTAV